MQRKLEKQKAEFEEKMRAEELRLEEDRQKAKEELEA